MRIPLRPGVHATDMAIVALDYFDTQNLRSDISGLMKLRFYGDLLLGKQYIHFNIKSPSLS